MDQKTRWGESYRAYRHVEWQRSAAEDATRPRRYVREAAQRPQPRYAHGTPLALEAEAAGLLVPRHNLPSPTSDLLGRERDLAVCLELLRGDEARLITLTGAGGVGKTRLAQHLGLAVTDWFPDGVWLVELAPVTNDLAPEAVAAVLGVYPEPTRLPIDHVLDFVRGKRILLILDNCEHLLAACRELVAALISDHGELRVLATSREALNVRGEVAVPVRPLEVPTGTRQKLAALSESPAVRLFVERARNAHPPFELTEDNAKAVIYICRRLGGLPLGLELAGAQVREMTAEEIAARLAESPDFLRGPASASSRHRSVHSVVAWSYELLTAAEQTLFRRLGVFVGGMSLEAIEAVCGEAGNAPEDVRGLVARLVGTSLVIEQQTQFGTRYALLEPIRQFAVKRLDATGETRALREKHAKFFRGLVAHCEQEIQGPRQVRCLEHLELEHGNLRAALAWRLEAGATDPAAAEERLDLAGAMWRFWEARGHVAEGRRWLAAALRGTEGVVSSARAKALDGLAILTHIQSDYVRAEALHEESLALKQQLGDQVGVAASLNSLGIVAKDRGELEKAQALHEQSIRLLRELGATRELAYALGNFGLLMVVQGNYAQAASLFEASLALHRERSDLRGMTLTLSNLGLVARNQGRYEEATRYQTECLALREQLGDRFGIALSLTNIGLIAQEQGEGEEAVRHQLRALDVFEELGNRWGMGLVRSTLALAAHYAGDRERAVRLAQESLEIYRSAGHQYGQGQALAALGVALHGAGDRAGAAARLRESITVRHSINDRHGLADSFEALAGVLVGQGLVERGARLSGAADAIRVAIEAPRAPVEAKELEMRLAPARDKIGVTAFDWAWKAGHGLGLDAAVSLAVEPVATAIGVQVQALGTGQVRRDGELVTTAEWRYSKPREVLFFLLQRPRATLAEIAGQIWLERERTDPRVQVQSAVSHIRRVLGHRDWVIFHEGFYSINRNLKLTFDVDTFEGTIAEARRTCERGPALRLYQEALALYGGEFLADIVEPRDWVRDQRAALSRLHLEAMLELGDLLWDDDQSARALDTYLRALNQDALVEAGHRGVMQCYGRMGEVGRVVEQYQHLCALLEREVGALPSPETQALFEKLRQDAS